jgi:hypothetical protein
MPRTNGQAQNKLRSKVFISLERECDGKQEYIKRISKDPVEEEKQLK